jgi:hypothetical protein
MLDIDHHSLTKALKDVTKVMEDTNRNSEHSFEFHSFKAENHPHRLAAVDGSNHAIKGVNFVLSTLRAGYLLYENGEIVKKEVNPIIMEFLMNNKDREVGFEYKHEAYFHRITGEIPNGNLQYDKVTERIRTLLEWEKIDELVDELGKDDIIIFDGSLISGEISTSHEYFNGIVKRCLEKGISLVGLSKDTSLSIDSASLPNVLSDSSKKHHPNRNWYVEYNDSYFVKFSKKKELIFRIDVVLPTHLTFEKLISWVGSYCFDPPTFGYPFPMQKIHDAVRISETDRDFCFQAFKKDCLQSGMSLTQFDKMFHIYHNQLDKISFGR